MKVTEKNRAKLRRELKEGDKVEFTPRGTIPGPKLGTITFPGSGVREGVCLVQVEGQTYSVDYYQVLAWYRNQ